MVKAKKLSPENKNELSFETALAQLEDIVKQLEQGELPLEDSLAQFSEGVELSQVCIHKLNAAEKQIDKIIQERQGKIIEKPLQTQEGE
ncbi:MAG: exodeoxyribonuclease VII small subunit [Veillonellales bacterium]